MTYLYLEKLHYFILKDNEMALEMEQLLQEAQDAAEEAEVNENIEQDPNITFNDQTNAQGCEGADVKGKDY